MKLALCSTHCHVHDSNCNYYVIQTSAEQKNEKKLSAIELETWKSMNRQIAFDVLFRMFSDVKADVHEEVEKDEKDLDAVLADVNVVDDAAALQRDANLVALAAARDCVGRRFGVVHVFGDVLK
jgi:hypothetical protein